MDIENHNNEKDIKVAYICLCHFDPEFIGRLAHRLDYNEDALFIHVDKKVDIGPFLNTCKTANNVFFCKDNKRVNNYWGGFNSIIATFNCIELAMSTANYDRFVLLQGQDYPLFSNEYIHNFFKEHNQIEFCKGTNISKSKNKNDYMKVGGYWHFDNILFIWKCIHRLNSLGIPYRKLRYKQSNKVKWDIYHGWAQFALTKECIEHCVSVYKNNRSYSRFIRNRFPPDELFFQTIIYNSRFKDNVYNQNICDDKGEKTKLNLTYFEYPDTVRVFKNKKDYVFLKNTGCLFVRKVNSSSRELIEEIDKTVSSDTT